MNTLISFLVVGLMVGALSRAVGRKRLTLAGAVAWGACGALVGGILAAVGGSGEPFHLVRTSDLVFAALGATAFLAVALLVRSPQADGRRRKTVELAANLLDSDRRSFETLSKRYGRGD